MVSAGVANIVIFRDVPCWVYFVFDKRGGQNKLHAKNSKNDTTQIVSYPSKVQEKNSGRNPKDNTADIFAKTTPKEPSYRYHIVEEQVEECSVQEP
jgi:hypothetical protein